MCSRKENKVSNKNKGKYNSSLTLTLAMRAYRIQNRFSSFVCSGQQTIFADSSDSHNQICITTGRSISSYWDFQISHLNQGQNKLFETFCLQKVQINSLCCGNNIIFSANQASHSYRSRRCHKFSRNTPWHFVCIVTTRLYASASRKV